MTAARLDLTSFLDVLTIILLALLVAQRDVDAAADAATSEAVTQLESRLRETSTERDRLAERADDLDEQLGAAREELDRLRAQTSEGAAQAELLELLAPLSDRERASTERLLAQALTVVYFDIRGDSIVAHRRLGDAEPTRFAAPVPLTRRIAQPAMSPTTEYVGDSLQRLAAALDNALVQRSPDDRVFYVFVDGDGLTTCASLVGLRRELAANPQLVAVLPPTRCE